MSRIQDFVKEKKGYLYGEILADNIGFKGETYGYIECAYRQENPGFYYVVFADPDKGNLKGQFVSSSKYPLGLQLATDIRPLEIERDLFEFNYKE